MKANQVDDVTDWFDGKTKPVRKGWYETPATIYNGAMRYWNGKHWLDSCMCCKSFDQDRKWRGLNTPNAEFRGTAKRSFDGSPGTPGSTAGEGG